MEYKYLKARGALNEAGVTVAGRPETGVPKNLAGAVIPEHLLQLVPESVARENLIIPVAFDGETITFAAANADDIAVADKLRFILAKDAHLLPAPREAVIAAINRNYGQTETEAVASMLQEFTDTAIDFSECEEDLALAEAAADDRTCSIQLSLPRAEAARQRSGLDPVRNRGAQGMLFYTVDEGQRVLMRRPDGTMEIIMGPRRVWRGWKTFQAMHHFVAHPGEFLVVRARNGAQEHLPGPVDFWLDPRVHVQVAKENALQIAAKEAVVVYSQQDSGSISRRIVFGPALLVPRPGEWLHTFSWHASKGGSRGVVKVPNALVFQKLWLMPDQMYHDVSDVRTADDAVLTIRLMIFFELVDIERMLDATHDPIGDFVNAATSDVVTFTGRHNFEDFKRNTGALNELDTYRQLTGRAGQCGYRINKVVFRGYGAADALQQMHDQAIQARTRLQLDRATEQQAQDLENYKLDCQLARAGKRRTEQVAEVEHDLALARTKLDEAIRQRETNQTSLREERRLEAEQQLNIRRQQDGQQREHLEALRGLGVDLTAFLTQARADQVIEFRGDTRPHVHLDKLAAAKTENGKAE
jgi:hypothetical protein